MVYLLDFFGLIMLQTWVNSSLPMSKFLTAIFTALLVVVVGLPLSAQAARVNTLVKGSGSAIYWAADNGKKYTFPNIETFYTWFSSTDLKAVKKITDKELKSIPTAGNVTYRGGAKLVKFPNEAAVYAVSRYGILRPIQSGDIAAQIYGTSWTGWVQTLPWSVRGDYRIGSTIRAAYEYSASQEYNGVKTPTDNLERVVSGPAPFNPNPASTFTGTLGLALTNRLYAPDRAQFTATVANANRDASQITIQIKNETRNEIIQTCYASYTCSTTWYVDTVATQEIVAIAKDAAGYSLGSNRVSIQGLNTNSSYSNYGYPYPYANNTYPYYNSYNTPYYGTLGTVTLSLSSANVYTNEQITAYAEVRNSTVSTDRLTTEIYVDGTRIGSCPSTTTCSLTFNNATANVTRQVYARVIDAAGNATESARQSIYVSDRTGYYGTYPYGSSQSSFWADARLTAEWTNDRRLRLTGSIVTANRSAQYVTFSIVDRFTNQVLKNCNGFDSCSIDVQTTTNTFETNRYAVIAKDWNGDQLNYVYAPTIGSNPYSYNNTYNPYGYNGYSYGYPVVTTVISRSGSSWWAPTFALQGNVSGVSNLSNTRLEIYVVDSTYSNPRLINTCYAVSTCTTQDTPNLSYGSANYYTVFVDSYGTQIKSVIQGS